MCLNKETLCWCLDNYSGKEINAYGKEINEHDKLMWEVEIKMGKFTVMYVFSKDALNKT